jgi:hypothetical protein
MWGSVSRGGLVVGAARFSLSPPCLLLFARHSPLSFTSFPARHSSLVTVLETSDLGLRTSDSVSCHCSSAFPARHLSLVTGLAITPLRTNPVLLRWADEPIRRFCVRVRPDFSCNLCAFSANKPARLLSISVQFVHSRVKAVFFTGHFVPVSCVFMHIAGSIFIFNISKGQRPVLDL